MVKLMPANMHTKLEFLDKLVWSRETWLSDHASKRPEHEVEMKRAGLVILKEIHEDYSRSIEKARAQA